MKLAKNHIIQCLLMRTIYNQNRTVQYIGVLILQLRNDQIESPGMLE
jgi:hypothetical protein